MTNFAAGLLFLLLVVPRAARAQDEASGGATPEPAIAGNAPAAPAAPGAPDARAEELRRLEAQLVQLEAKLDEARKAAEPPRLGRRTVGLGLATGGGVLGGRLTESFNPSLWPEAWAVGRLPSVEARVFLVNGMSVDVSLPLGDILVRLAGSRLFVFVADAFWNFNLPVSPGVHLLLGPGVGFSAGEYSASTISGFPGAPAFGGEVRVEMRAGAEFLTAGGHLGITLTARPHMDLLFLKGTVSPAATVSTFFAAGVLGLVGLNYYFVAR